MNQGVKPVDRYRIEEESKKGTRLTPRAFHHSQKQVAQKQVAVLRSGHVQDQELRAHLKDCDAL
ncbi:hypothetical protein HGP16_06150 [Rhizobium sp. P40RR-XXII]|uniref:hypothetical protein n=1 Tax=unclassified Rhizobium TaxID=2613769 RepID=UPI001456C313|nr:MULTISPECIES: hypothetical protein [unclassified Rhizobium]NLR83720.1 hypothetical protein [Rhizobium sp. P28RR-XV]NLS16140.1 hypothetical protein [Rhizobium sp. P40RR-XXII]